MSKEIWLWYPDSGVLNYTILHMKNLWKVVRRFVLNFPLEDWTCHPQTWTGISGNLRVIKFSWGSGINKLMKNKRFKKPVIVNIF